jgi:hypothetical protein
MPARPLFASIVLAASLVAAGCAFGGDKEGSGEEGFESRDVGPFDRIALSGSADLVVTVGGAQEVTVRGDDNLLDDIDTDVNNGQLEISQDDDLDPEIGLTVEISTPALEEVDVSGAGDVDVQGVRGESFRVEVSGAGDVNGSGQADRVEVEISGAGDVQLAELIAREATVEISGAGNVHVNATESLDASISGAGDIVYSGNPREVETDVSGAGDITAAE